MANDKTLILNAIQIRNRINRIAYQIYEDNFEEKEIVIAGIVSSGYELAKRVKSVLKKIAPFEVQLLKIIIDKKNPLKNDIKLDVKPASLKGKTVIIVDDVMNSGKTMAYAIQPFLQIAVKKVRTVVLVDRDHKAFPVSADFFGISLATTIQEHVIVDFSPGNDEVYLT